MKTATIRIFLLLGGLLAAVLLLPAGALVAEAGNCASHITGYTCRGHGHNFEGLSTCSKCAGAGTVTETVNGFRCRDCGNFSSTRPTGRACPVCSNVGVGTTPWYKPGTKEVTTICDRCSGHGRNTRCKNGGCSYSSYGWHNGGSIGGRCYTCGGCEAVTGDHEASGSATCTAAAACRYCGTALSPALGHSWGNKYVSGTRWIRSCTRGGCGATRDEGSAQYTVSFHGNGGNSVSMPTKVITYGNTYGPLPSAVREGYSLAGWWTLSSGGAQIGSATRMQREENHTLYAHWTANSYTVSFHGNGGSVTAASRTVIYDTGNWNQGASRAERTGYTFLGYYTAASGGLQVYDSNGNAVDSSGYWQGSGGSARWKRAGNVTLYAQWKINTYTVTYDANGGSAVSKTAETVTYNAPVNLDHTASWREGSPEDMDFVFTGWSTDPYAVSGLESYRMPAGDVTLYAVWSIPVSDVKEVYLGAWPRSLPQEQRTVENGKIYSLHTDRTTSRGYYDSIGSTRISEDFGGEAVDVFEYAWDHAANVSIYGVNAPAIRWFQQTVHHLYYSDAKKGWREFAVTGAMALEGSSYTPEHIGPPEGYRADTIDPPYQVEGDRDSYAYYRPVTYHLYYDANGGVCEVEQREISFGSLYGVLPTARRYGYTFTGWYTQREDGTRIRSKDLYETAGDSTIYAQWEANVHQVRYDYAINGGSSCETAMETAAFGQAVRLDVAAVKEGWEHIGWNTDPEAVCALEHLTMEDTDLILYAVYRREITATFIDRDEEGQKTRTDTCSIYNRAEYAGITVPDMHVWNGWNGKGYSRKPDPWGVIEASARSTVKLREDTVFYGIYQQEITVSYDANGSPEELPGETKSRFYNASDSYGNPEFVLKEAPGLSGHSFVCWRDPSGNSFDAGSQTVLEKDTEFCAAWDRYPEIEAYDRYFTLEEAQGGAVTPEVLLETVTGRDWEDGELEKGRQVTVVSYLPEDFTDFASDGSVTVTYQAVDSFGNVTRKQVTAHVVDASLKENPYKSYVRFLGEPFYRGDGFSLAREDGGLEDTSLWREEESYRSSLEHALSNEKQQEETVQQEFMGKIYEIKKPGSGSWQHQVSVWTLRDRQLSRGEGRPTSYPVQDK